MLYIPSLLTISLLYLVAAVSPGPSFFVISQLSLSGKKVQATQVALGISTGSVVWAVLAMVGVSALLATTEWLYTAVSFIGMAYLIWLGLKVLKGAFFFNGSNDEPISAHMSSPRAWRTGLLTSMTNPKSGAFWTSVFATTVPVAAPIWFYLTQSR